MLIREKIGETINRWMDGRKDDSFACTGQKESSYSKAKRDQ